MNGFFAYSEGVLILLPMIDYLRGHETNSVLCIRNDVQEFVGLIASGNIMLEKLYGATLEGEDNVTPSRQTLASDPCVLYSITNM